MTNLLNALTTHATWMSETERELAATCAEQLRAELEQHGLPETTTAALRIHAVVRALLLVSRAERALDAEGFAADFGGVAKNAAAAIACIGRAQDLLRKACKDFDDYCRRESAARAKSARLHGQASPQSPASQPHQANSVHAAGIKNDGAPPSNVSPQAQDTQPHLTSLQSPSAPLSWRQQKRQAAQGYPQR